MTMLPFLLKMTENDKRFLIIIILLLCVLLSLLVIIALIIESVGKSQAKKVDGLMHDAVFTGIITSKKEFIKVARRKNHIYFYKHARIAVLIIALHFIGAAIFVACMNAGLEDPIYSYGGLYGDYETYGLATIFHIYDFSKPTYTSFFGWFDIITNYELLSTPHFEVNGLFAYIFIPLLIVGLLMFAYQVEGLIARTIKIQKRAKEIYDKSLEGVKYDELNSSMFKSDAITVEKPGVVQNNQEQDKK